MHLLLNLNLRVKIKKYARKWKILSKIKNYTQISKFCQKSNFLTKIQTFCQKSKIMVKNRNLLWTIKNYGQKSKLFVKIKNYDQYQKFSQRFEEVKMSKNSMKLIFQANFPSSDFLKNIFKVQNFDRLLLLNEWIVID